MIVTSFRSIEKCSNGNAPPCNIQAQIFDPIPNKRMVYPTKKHYMTTVSPTGLTITVVVRRSDNTSRDLVCRSIGIPTSCSKKGLSNLVSVSGSSFCSTNPHPLPSNNSHTQQPNQTKPTITHHNHNQLLPAHRNHQHVIQRRSPPLRHSQNGRKNQGLRAFLRRPGGHRAVWA